MKTDEVTPVRETVDAVYRAESRRVLATLIRLLGWIAHAARPLWGGHPLGAVVGGAAPGA